MKNAERRRELGRFLRNRRARLLPVNVGLTSAPGRRRVTGLRREEVAALAGVGVTWYTMLENGSARGVSSQTLEAIAGALRLDDAEAKYLRDLADESDNIVPLTSPDRLTLATIDAIEWAPAYVCTLQWTVLAWNRAMSLVWDIEAPGAAPFNIVIRMFADRRMRALHGARFEAFAVRLVAMVRSSAGAHFADPEYLRMYETLRSDAVFADAWDAYEVAAPLGPMPIVIDSPALGEFSYEALTLLVPDDGGHSIVIQVPDVSSAARLRDALRTSA